MTSHTLFHNSICVFHPLDETYLWTLLMNYPVDINQLDLYNLEPARGGSGKPLNLSSHKISTEDN